MINAKSSLVDVAFVVCNALDQVGIVAVMTGGSAATFYAPQQYTSHDIDFVLTFGGTAGAEALTRLGFVAENTVYKHAETVYTIEFPPGPLAVGDDPISSWETFRRDDRLLHVISRTDSVRDRLSAYYHWNDVASLYVAKDVALSGSVDWNIIEKWSRREGHAEKFHDLRKLLS